MKTLFFPIFFSILIISHSCSCKKDSTVGSSNTEFPNTVGTFWKYKVYDSVFNNLDTVLIQVIGNTMLQNGDNAAIWSLHSLYYGNDTNYVTNKSDGINIYYNRYATSSIKERYVFPLALGKSWTGQLIQDTIKVSEQGTVSVIAGIFSNAFKLNQDFRTYPGLNITKQEEWFVPNIGMVSRQYRYSGTAGVENKKWELVSFLIK